MQINDLQINIAMTTNGKTNGMFCIFGWVLQEFKHYYPISRKEPVVVMPTAMWELAQQLT